jgi:hypothetical protein
VQRHRNDAIGVIEEVTGSGANGVTEGLRQRASLVIFERVNDLAQRVLVLAGGTPAGNRW